MSYLSNYPPGAQFDDLAPWNAEADEPMFCGDCGVEVNRGNYCEQCDQERNAKGFIWSEDDDDN